MANTKLGLCVSPNFIPSAAQLVALNPPFLRSILYTLEDVQPLVSTQLPIIITLNNQCKEVGGDWSGWDGAIYSLCNLMKNQLIVLEAGNELDLFWDKNHNDCPPEFAASLAIRASSVCKQAGYSTKVTPTSVASASWTTYIELLANLCEPYVDYFNLHPYGKQPTGWGPPNWGFGLLSEAIQVASDLTGGNKPIICTEYGVKIGDAGSVDEVANFLQAGYQTLSQSGVPYCGWFASEDAVGAPDERGGDAFGLVSDTSIRRHAWFQYQSINLGPSNIINVPPPPVPISPSIYDVWKGKVGKGLLDMMAEDGTYPAMASEWRPFDRPLGTAATIEQAIGMNGTVYMWHIPTKTKWRTEASYRGVGE